MLEGSLRAELHAPRMDTHKHMTSHTRSHLTPTSCLPSPHALTSRPPATELLRLQGFEPETVLEGSPLAALRMGCVHGWPDSCVASLNIASLVEIPLCILRTAYAPHPCSWECNFGQL